MTISLETGGRPSENTLLLGFEEVQPFRRDFDSSRGIPALEVPGEYHDVPAGTPNACPRTEGTASIPLNTARDHAQPLRREEQSQGQANPKPPSICKARTARPSAKSRLAYSPVRNRVSSRSISRSICRIRCSSTWCWRRRAINSWRSASSASRRKRRVSMSCCRSGLHPRVSAS